MEFYIRNTAIRFLNVVYSTPLKQGINNYRAVITLNNGSIIVSNEDSVYYFKSQHYIIVPNPIQHQSSFSVLSESVSSNTIMLFDMAGRKLLTKKISEQHQNIATANLAAGIYLIVIYNDLNEKVYTTKIVIN